MSSNLKIFSAIFGLVFNVIVPIIGQGLGTSELNERMTILENNFQTRITALEQKNDDLNKNLAKALEIIHNYDTNTDEKMAKFEEDAEMVTNLLKDVNGTLDFMSRQMKDVSLNITKEKITERLLEFSAKVNETLINFNVSVHQHIRDAINDKSNAKLSDIDGKIMMTNVLLLCMFMVAIILIVVFILRKYKMLKCDVKNKDSFELVTSEPRLLSKSENVKECEVV